MRLKVDKKFYGLLLLSGLLLFLLPIIKTFLISVVFSYSIYPTKKLFKKVVKNNSLASLLTVIVWLLVGLYLVLFIALTALNSVGSFINLYNSGAFDTFINLLKETIFKYVLVNVSLDSLLNPVIISISNFLTGAPSLVVQLFIVLFTSYYLIKDGDQLVKFISDELPFNKKDTERLINKVNKITRSVVYGYLITGLVVGLLMLFFLLIIRGPQPFLLGFLTILFSILPLMGPVIPGLIVIVYFLFKEEFLLMVLTIVFVFCLSFVDNLIRPHVSKTGEESVHPLIFFLGMLSGYYILGYIGVIVGPIIVGVILSLIKDSSH